ncbi:threonylcarbamoyl-AMP synthase [Candidatus Roizmanbacteria bacterium]|nr:threonylcarbamoyl-AMP synthase [Candidatus Roizmanbacteria bacterium]
MSIKRITENNYSQVLHYTVEVLKKGGLVIFPSDTVYGLLVDATNEKAVKKLIEFKDRSPGKAISVFVSDFKMLKNLVVINNIQEKRLKEILPGSFTVVLKSRGKVSFLLESEKKTLGVRLIKYKFVNSLLKSFGKPTTATSANLTNRPSHYSIESLQKELPKKKLDMIDLIVDAGKLPRNKPSTVVDMTEADVKIIRKGDVDFSNSQVFNSGSPQETKKMARKIFSDFKKTKKPLAFIIEGELGVGKTVFVKGAAESLGINNIVSPTFVIYYEYGNFYHFDLYQIEDKNEFKYLEIDRLLKPGNILFFEWGEKAGEIYNLLKSKAIVIYVKMEYINEKKRKITIKL